MLRTGRIAGIVRVSRGRDAGGPLTTIDWIVDDEDLWFEVTARSEEDALIQLRDWAARNPGSSFHAPTSEVIVGDRITTHDRCAVLVQVEEWK